MNRHSSTFLRVSNLVKHFRVSAPWSVPLLDNTASVVKALDGVSFTVEKGETFGLLGESGCGKTTLARTLLRLIPPTEGEVWLEGRDVLKMSREELRTSFRSRVRMIFQHPDAVLNPACTVFVTLDQALSHHTNLGAEARRQRAEYLLDKVDLAPEYLDKYPDELSGGQKRRVGICRALATDPDVIVADEPFSGLDISLQEQILGVFLEIQEARNLTTLVISHDTGLMRRLCERIGIMQGGRLVQILSTGKITPEHCDHPYAESLLRAHFTAHNAS